MAIRLKLWPRLGCSAHARFDYFCLLANFEAFLSLHVYRMSPLVQCIVIRSKYDMLTDSRDDVTTFTNILLQPRLALSPRVSMLTARYKKPTRLRPPIKAADWLSQDLRFRYS